MKPPRRGVAAIAALAIAAALCGRSALAGHEKHEQLARYVLATVKAFRTVYDDRILEHVKRAGVEPKENWTKDDHGIMLHFDFIREAGAEIEEFELTLIGLTPINKANLPKTRAEADALKAMAANPKQTVIMFTDGAQFKGLMADYAISRSCVDCHNTHPGSPRRDFEQGDLLGAIVVRMNR
jgi:hypothetical protein